MCGNGPHFAVGYLATIGLGAICVPLNPASPPVELANQLAHVEAKALLVGPGAGASWAGVDRADVPSVEIVVSAEPDGDAHPWDEVAAHEPLATVELEPDHLAALLFTSGTAGRPQAAMLSHGNLRANIDQSLSATDRMRADDVVFGVLPLFHIFGLNVALGITLAAGASVVLVQRFDPSTALDTIAERGVTVLPGAPPMWLAWAAMEGIDPGAFANVRLCLTGASKMPEAAARLLAERFGVALREGYGLTECSPGGDVECLHHPEGRLDRGAHRGRRGAPGRPRRRRCPRRRRRRGVGARPQRLPGLLERSRRPPRGCSTPTGGCTPATSPSPTTTATSTSSTGPRT